MWRTISKGPPNSSTLSNDAFPERKFDFMLSNPPYGKNWSNDLAAMGGKNFYDPRFVIGHAGNPNTRSSRAQATGRCCSSPTCSAR